MNYQYSNFWNDDLNSHLVDDFLGVEEEKKKGKDLIALAGYRRAISNFVSIVTGKSIPVEFNSNDNSYTTGKKVVLGSNLNDKNFDVAVGLALHEGSHILLSDFDLLNELRSNIPTKLITKTQELGMENTTKYVKSILNYIEDRRIDYYMFKTSPGYKGYYHSMYNKYFYNSVVDKGLLSNEYRKEDWNSYEFRLINLHNSNRQLKALNGLRDIWNTINLPKISRLKSSKDVLDVSLKVYEIILNNIEPNVKNDSNEADGRSGNTTKTGAGDATPETTSSNETANDDGSETKELTESQKRNLPKAIEKQKNFIDGNIRKGKLSKKDSNDMKTLEDSGAKYEDVGKNLEYSEKTKCLVVNNLTKKLIDSNVFDCASSWNFRRYDKSSYSDYNFVEEGLRLGTVLGKKLKIRSEERSTKYTRKNSGKIDKRLLSELGFGNTNIFSQILTDRYNKAYLHISIDASGSMSGDKWNKSMTSAIAMIKACDMAGNIEVVVSIRTTHNGSGRDAYMPLIMVIYDSRKDNLTKVRTLFKALGTTGTTPEGLCFEAIAKDLIPGNDNQDSYFINYSDGCPMFSTKDFYYRGYEAENHTRKQVTKMKNLGIKVLSYYISGDYHYDSDKTAFRTMYGKDAQFINATSMMEVARTMNKKFLER